jgi:galactose mutarotase-like enzyme
MQSYTISSADKKTTASFVPDRGGAASSIIMHGVQGARELLFLEDAFWDKDSRDLPGGAPFCFPICGRLFRDGEAGVYLYEGHRYMMDIHGFAWKKRWQVSAHTDDSIVMCLADDEDTLKQYPFNFALTITYTVKDNALHCGVSITNTGRAPMPYYAGFHPYFLMPDGLLKKEVMLDLQSSHRYQYNSMLTDIVGRLPALDFPCSVSEPAINESLNVIHGDHAFSLSYPSGDVLQMRVHSEPYDLLSFVQLYTRDDAPFMCVEPWMGHPNAMNTAGAVRYLPAGAQDTINMTITLE